MFTGETMISSKWMREGIQKRRESRQACEIGGRGETREIKIHWWNEWESARERIARNIVMSDK
ncbi:hypothetical protein N7467_002691 [Penicillium canescens]|nr:hypothetical protein N7467_002691 [Penicillium canescens]